MNYDGNEECRKHLHTMYILENRLKSFKGWVFQDNCECTPDKMAQAGFFHCPSDQEPDCVRCFVCHKELDGWEPSDVPLLEHKKHSKDCPFLPFASSTSLTVDDVMKLNRDRYRLLLEKTAAKKVEELEEYAKEALKQMEKLLNN